MLVEGLAAKVQMFVTSVYAFSSACFFSCLGICFARDVSYSHQHCLSSTDHHSVSVARVHVGDFAQRNQVYLHSPTRPGISNRLLDSCVNNWKKIPPPLSSLRSTTFTLPISWSIHVRSNRDHVRGNNILSVACKNLISDSQRCCSSVSFTGVEL